MSTRPTGADEGSTGGPLPRGYSTPECRTGGARWPDLHELCHAPGYQDRVLGWVPVPCSCACHGKAAEEPAS
ncbi:hypothetical protein [Streptacidiphilus anmyonensis]|uniref:hypothetical protein n=1 Tax=Streptacidiphilus anmyonensis TaxID=405782 RepID=UPI0005A70964|nr:hypothetical protein [Streptacidiphilus anmyonensis]